MSVGGIERLRRIAYPDIELFALLSLHEDALADGIDFHDTYELLVTDSNRIL